MAMDLEPSVTPINESMEMNVVETVEKKSDETHTSATMEGPETTAVLTETQLPARVREVERSVASISERLRKAAVMSGLFTTLFISALNSTIVATAIPTISSEFKSAAGYAWIGGAYTLANTAAAPIWVKLSDIFGRKMVILTGVGLYFFATILCATSVSMRMLIASRTLAGVAGGGLIQLVFVIISDLFSMKERSLYLGLLQIMWAIAGGTGPVLGGLFTEYLSWRWIFWINLPVSGTSFLLLFFFLDIHNPRTSLKDGLKAIDWYGSATMLGVMLMLLLGLDFGGAIFPWKSPTVICLIVISGLMIPFFIFIEEKFAKHPLIPLGIFKGRSNIASLLLGFCHDFCFVSLDYYLPLFFQSVLGRSPLLSGALSAPLSAIIGLSGIATGIIIHRTGRYLELVYLGSALQLVGTGLLILLSATSTVPFIIGLEIIAGIGAGFLFEPPVVALQAHLPQEAVGTAISTLGLVRNLASCFAIVLGGVIFQNGMGDQAAGLYAAGLSPDLVQTLTGSAAAANVGVIATINDPKQKLVVHQAFAESLKLIWITAAVMAAGVLICGVFIEKTHLSDVHEETRTGVGHEKEPVEVGRDEN